MSHRNTRRTTLSPEHYTGRRNPTVFLFGDYRLKARKLTLCWLPRFRWAAMGFTPICGVAPICGPCLSRRRSDNRRRPGHRILDVVSRFDITSAAVTKSPVTAVITAAVVHCRRADYVDWRRRSPAGRCDVGTGCAKRLTAAVPRGRRGGGLAPKRRTVSNSIGSSPGDGRTVSRSGSPTAGGAGRRTRRCGCVGRTR